MQPLLQGVKINQAAFFAHGFLQILESGSPQHFQNLHLAAFHLVVQALHRPVNIQIEQFFGGGLLFQNGTVRVGVQCQQGSKINQGGGSPPLHRFLAVGGQANAPGGNNRNQMTTPAGQQVMVNRPHRLGGDKIIVLVPQPVNVKHIHTNLQKVFNFFLNGRQNFHPADNVMFTDFQVTANQCRTVAGRSHTLANVADQLVHVRVVLNFKHGHGPQVG